MQSLAPRLLPSAASAASAASATAAAAAASAAAGATRGIAPAGVHARSDNGATDCAADGDAGNGVQARVLAVAVHRVGAGGEVRKGEAERERERERHVAPLWRHIHATGGHVDGGHAVALSVSECEEVAVLLRRHAPPRATLGQYLVYLEEAHVQLAGDRLGALFPAFALLSRHVSRPMGEEKSCVLTRCLYEVRYVVNAVRVAVENSKRGHGVMRHLLNRRHCSPRLLLHARKDGIVWPEHLRARWIRRGLPLEGSGARIGAAVQHRCRGIHAEECSLGGCGWADGSRCGHYHAHG
mmetsp:Transcript_21409/g.69280  ORF Transcript_21409/g.69280 Transcript_21409/m.69280 type:complete len:297 (-) Transcript_21409:585-1475(-)